MSIEVHLTIHVRKTADMTASEDVDGHLGSRERDGLQLDDHDYDMETVERVYRYSFPTSCFFPSWASHWGEERKGTWMGEIPYLYLTNL